MRLCVCVQKGQSNKQSADLNAISTLVRNWLNSKKKYREIAIFYDWIFEKMQCKEAFLCAKTIKEMAACKWVKNASCLSFSLLFALKSVERKEFNT